MKLIRYGMVGSAIILLILFIRPHEGNQKQEVLVSKEATVSIQEPKPKEWNLLGLGDSVVKGYGVADDQNMLHVLGTSLQKSWNEPVHIENEGVNGLTSTKLLAYVQTPEVKDKIQQADIIVIHIGGNDLLKLARKEGLFKTFQSFRSIKATSSQNMIEIVMYIRQQNSDALLVMYQLYNPIDPDDSYYKASGPLFSNWNNIYRDALEEDDHYVIVPTKTVLSSKTPQRFNEDGVHPNEKGHAALAKEALQRIQQKKEH